jgi:hypothetical protein
MSLVLASCEGRSGTILMNFAREVRRPNLLPIDGLNWALLYVAS